MEGRVADGVDSVGPAIIPCSTIPHGRSIRMVRESVQIELNAAGQAAVFRELALFHNSNLRRADVIGEILVGCVRSREDLYAHYTH